MIWLGIVFPSLPLDVFLRASSRGAPTVLTEQQPPVAVIDHQRVLRACAHALRQGIHPGMKRATALALQPDLLLRERDPRREQDALVQAAIWALQFTPSVSLQSSPAPELLPAGSSPPLASGLLMEIAPSLRLFGGRESLIAQLRNGLSDLGFAVQIACAPTATAAWLMARHQDGLLADDQALLNARLACIPIDLLDSSQAHLEVLESLGAQTLKQLVQLPRAGLARRFGPALLTELDRAFGRVPEPRAWFEVPPSFAGRLELFAQVDDAQALLFAARRLVVSLCGWLAARHAAARSIRLLACHDEGPATPIDLLPADATRDAERLVILLREKLTTTRLRAPVHTLHLACDEVTAMAPVNATLFALPANARESLGRLIERLQARLGRDRVLRLLPVADHRPENAYHLANATLESLSEKPARPEKPLSDPAQAALPRPLWLMTTPEPLTERDNRPWWHGPLTLLAGPERIETGWWDNHLVQRDYFIGSDETGLLLWLYRERLPGPEARAGWFLQGRFG